MSKFYAYAEKLNTLAKTSFEAYRAAEANLKDAERRAGKYRGEYFSPEMRAAAARAQADLETARAALNTEKHRLLEDRPHDIAMIRAELKAAVDDAFAARPEDIDGDTVTLLESGILTSDEFQRLLDTASNATMKRVIVAHAQKAAERRGREYGADDAEVMALRGLTYTTNTDPGSEILANFDFLAHVFNRTADNVAMIDDWDSLTGDVVENF